MIESNYGHIVGICSIACLLLFRCLLCYQIYLLDRAWQTPFIFTAYHTIFI